MAEYLEVKTTEIMTLNNNIAIKQKNFEKLEEEKNKLQAIIEESSTKKLDETSEVGQILMSIENLYNKCINRKRADESKKVRQAIQYTVSNDQEPLKNFNNIKKRGDLALVQLSLIENHMLDFQSLIDTMMGDEKVYVKYNLDKGNDQIV